MRNEDIFLLENLKGRDHSENLGINGKTILECMWEVVDWMHLAQDRDQWRGLVNTVMKLWVP
jgi:hypothetical protein